MPDLNQNTLDDDDSTDPDALEWRAPAGRQVVRMLPEPEEIEETPLDRVQAILGMAKDDDKSVLKLYRLVNSKMAWCGDYKVSEFEDGGFEMIRKEYGPGDYHLRLYGIGPTGRFVVRTKTDLTIMARASDGASPNAVGGGEMGRMLAMMQEQNNKMLAAIQERQTQDPMAAMQQAMAMIASMKDVIGGGAQGGLLDTVNAIKALREVADEINPKTESGEPSLMGMLPSFLELVKTGMDKQSEFQAAQPVHIALPASIAAANPPPAVSRETSAPQIMQTDALQNPAPALDPEVADDMNAFRMLKLRMLMGTLLKMAQKNAPPSEAGDLLLTELPDEMLDALELDDWYPQLEAGCKMLGIDIAPHRAWVTTVRDYIMTPDDEDEAAPDAAPGMVG